MFKKFICSILVIGLIASCSKSTPTPATSLTIHVKNANGTTVSGATVYLFTSSTDMNNAFQTGNFNSAIASGNTDGNGDVTFNSNLSLTTYYYYVKDGCESNLFGNQLSNNQYGSVTDFSLTPNQNNDVSCTLGGVGTLKLTNTSSNPYEVYVNGQVFFQSFQGNYTVSTPFPTGSYQIRVVQLSGYAVYPTDETFTGTLTCGSTLTTTFP